VSNKIATVLWLAGFLALCLRAEQFVFINETKTWDGKTQSYNLTRMGPSNWVSPVNYVDGKVYIRYELIQRPSDKIVPVQLCMWQDSWSRESCCQCNNTKPVQVYYWDAGTPSQWWRKSPLDYTRPFQRASMMHKNESCSGVLLMSESCGSHCYVGSDLNLHVPITFKLTVIVVSQGAVFTPPADWAGNPWGNDETPPTLKGVSSTRPDQVKVTFSEWMDKASAENTANYTIPGITVSNASLNGSVVTLSTSALTEGTVYRVTISNVKDLSGNAILGAPQGSFAYAPFTGWQDDFDDGNADGWTTGEGAWSVSGGAYANSSAGRTSSWAGEPDWADITFAADVKPASGTDVWMIFRVQDAQNYYLFTLNGSSGALYKLVNGGYTKLADGSGVAFATGSTYAMKVEMVGGSIKVYSGSTPVCQATDNQFAAGYVGFGSNGAGGSFDNVQVSTGTTPVSGHAPGLRVLPRIEILPNPFNTKTKISVYLNGNTTGGVETLHPGVDNHGRTGCNVSTIHPHIAIYNIRGKFITQFDTSIRNPKSEIHWDASGLSPGLYLVRLRAGNYTVIKKLVLVR
jgi:hypothetical protein